MQTTLSNSLPDVSVGVARTQGQALTALAFLLFAGVAQAQNNPLRLHEAGDNANEIQAFADQSEEAFGKFGLEAAWFLIAGMPVNDLKNLKADFLNENLRLAMQARERFPWCRDLPKEMFFNDVLPYASLDEPRHPWRADFFKQATAIVEDSNTAGDAAQALNRDFFKQVDVQYSTKRKRPNQSPKESMEQGLASCSGLSIILVDACRAVGVPARVAGIPSWTTRRGNHNWVEVWDGKAWRFTGAGEYNPKGLDRAWFAGDAAKADPNRWEHRIYASSWKRGELFFPMVWDLKYRELGAVDVTARYLAAKTPPSAPGLALRVIDADRKRLAAKVRLESADGETLQTATTRVDPADWNDVLQLDFGTHTQGVLTLVGKRRCASVWSESADRGCRDLGLDLEHRHRPILWVGRSSMLGCKLRGRFGPGCQRKQANP